MTCIRVVAGLLAGILAAPAIASPHEAAPSRASVGAAAPRLSAEIPRSIRRGEAVTLVLHVTTAQRPVEAAVACLAAVPLFISIEDALDSTPAGGVDLGSGSSSSGAAQPGCEKSSAGLPQAPGVYAFTWEPDTPGRVTLTFTAAGGTLTLPVDVASAPPDTTVLVSFALLTAAILGIAACVRRRSRLPRAAP
jgi:hypothetical protein